MHCLNGLVLRTYGYCAPSYHIPMALLVCFVGAIISRPKLALFSPSYSHMKVYSGLMSLIRNHMWPNGWQQGYFE